MLPERYHALLLAATLFTVTPSCAAQAQPPSSSTGAGNEMQLDPQAAERALERTLVSTGQLLLPRGAVELGPHLSYTRISRSEPIFHVVDNQAIIGAREVRRDLLDVGLEIRLGLANDSQFEIDIPYRFLTEDDVVTAGGTPLSTDRDNGSGFGDVRVGLAQALSREGAGRVNLIARIEWDTATGETADGDVALGGFGYDELEASLSGTKRQDPLVFTGRASYRVAQAKDGIKPGNALGISFGTVLAASPETSLRLQLDQSFMRDAEIDGDSIAGTSQVVAMLGLGASSIIGRGRFLDLLVGTGITDEAPEYTVVLSVSSRL